MEGPNRRDDTAFVIRVVLGVRPTGQGAYEGKKRFGYLKWASHFWISVQNFIFRPGHASPVALHSAHCALCAIYFTLHSAPPSVHVACCKAPWSQHRLWLLSPLDCLFSIDITRVSLCIATLTVNFPGCCGYMPFFRNQQTK